MNYCDIFVLGIIVLFGVIGLSKGFIVSFFRLISFFLSVIVSVKLYPIVAGILMKTKLYTTISMSVFKTLMQQKDSIIPEIMQEQQALAQKITENLRLPDFLKADVSKGVSGLPGMFDASNAVEAVSGQVAKVAISVISFILVYLIIRIILSLLEFILRGIAKLPIFKQMDKLGGFAFGAVEGLLTVYLISAAFMFLNMAPQLKGVFEQLESSSIARFFFDNNFLMRRLL